MFVIIASTPDMRANDRVGGARSPPHDGQPPTDGQRVLPPCPGAGAAGTLSCRRIGVGRLRVVSGVFMPGRRGEGKRQRVDAAEARKRLPLTVEGAEYLPPELQDGEHALAFLRRK